MSYSNLFKAGWVTFNEDARVIDANEIMEQRMKEEASLRRSYGSSRAQEDEEGFAAGLEAARVDALLDPNGENALLKSASHEELEELERKLEAAREELEQVREETDRMAAQANAEIAQQRARTLEEARNQGYREGYDKGMAETRAQKEQYLNMQAQLKEEYQRQVEELEPDFIETLTEIYEHIFKVDLSSYHQLVVHLLTDAMQKTDSARNYIVHVSKQDYQGVSGAREQILEETGTLPGNLEIISDMTLSPSQCMIETEDGIYDCSLGTELEELRRKLRLISFRK